MIKIKNGEILERQFQFSCRLRGALPLVVVTWICFFECLYMNCVCYNVDLVNMLNLLVYPSCNLGWRCNDYASIRVKLGWNKFDLAGFIYSCSDSSFDSFWYLFHNKKFWY